MEEEKKKELKEETKENNDETKEFTKQEEINKKEELEPPKKKSKVKIFILIIVLLLLIGGGVFAAIHFGLFKKKPLDLSGALTITCYNNDTDKKVEMKRFDGGEIAYCEIGINKEVLKDATNIEIGYPYINNGDIIKTNTVGKTNYKLKDLNDTFKIYFLVQNTTPNGSFSIDEIIYEIDGEKHIGDPKFNHQFTNLNSNDYYNSNFDNAVDDYILSTNKIPTSKEAILVSYNLTMRCKNYGINDDGTVYYTECDNNGREIPKDSPIYQGVLHVYKHDYGYEIIKNDYPKDDLIEEIFCKSKHCTGMVDGQKLIVYDRELKVKDLSKQNNYHYPKSKENYTIPIIEKNFTYDDATGIINMFVHRYKFDDYNLDILDYNYIINNNDYYLQGTEYGFDYEDGVLYYLGNSTNSEIPFDVSYNDESLKNGHILLTTSEYESTSNTNTFEKLSVKRIDLYDYKNKKIIKNIKNDLYKVFGLDDESTPDFFLEEKNGRFFVNISGAYIEFVILKNDGSLLSNELYSSDSIFYSYKNGNILLTKNKEYYIIQNDNSEKKVFEKLEISDIDVDINEKVSGVSLKEKDKKFMTYDLDGQLVKESKEYQDIYAIYNDDNHAYLYVNDNKRLKLVDAFDNEIADFMEITDDLTFEDQHYGTIFFRNKKIKEGNEGAYVSIYYIFEENKKYIEKMEYMGGYGKPVLYLYPKEETNVVVTFEHPEMLSITYPLFNKEWKVRALPDGSLYDTNNKYYYGLYWEEDNYHQVDFSEGFYVKASDSISFLEEKLSYIGLNDRERNEFIMYWLPIMQRGGDNLVYFELTEERESTNKLLISPKPDSILRVAIHLKKVDKEIKIKEEKLKPFKRYGFTAIEWGGKTY